MKQGRLDRSYSQIATEMDRGGVETRRKAMQFSTASHGRYSNRGVKAPFKSWDLLGDNTPLFISGVTELSSDH
jgi:hypothetical protein